MFETEHLGLPLVQAAQAQKHVTVNEGLLRLDGVVQLVLESASVGTPPTVPFGAFAVPLGAVNAWAGHEGKVAIAANGGWDFVTPRPGWRGWLIDEGGQAVFDGQGWQVGAISIASGGSGMRFRTIELDHVIQPGAISTTAAIIPAQSIVYGVTGRVMTEIAGTATSFTIGIAGDSPDRYGSGYGVQAGAWMRGLTASPLTYYAEAALTLTGTGGGFTSGEVRLAVHLTELAVPTA